MIEKRIERTTSRTAAMTCMSRAASYLESNRNYHSNDHIAVKILPRFIGALIHDTFYKGKIADNTWGLRDVHWIIGFYYL